MHAAGLIHGCLRPENVIIDDTLKPVVANTQAVDVAAACRKDASSELAGSAYVAPEVRGGRTPDERSDVFSLGQVLHFVLAGAEPAITQEHLPKLASLRDAPSGLVRIVRQCTARDPAERYADANELVEELEAYDRGEKVGVGHPEVAERYDTVRHAAALRRTQQKRAAEAPLPEEDSSPEPSDSSPSEPPPQHPAPPMARKPEGDENKRRFHPIVGGIGLLALGGATLGCYLTGEPSIGLGALAGLGALLASSVIPSFGAKPAISRLLLALLCLGAVIAIDPTGRAAEAGDRSHDLHQGDVEQRVSTLKALRAEGKKRFIKLDLSGADLSGMDLSKAELDGSSLSGALCKGTRFDGASMLNVTVTDADFSGASLEDINATQLVGWASARCDDDTVLPRRWSCESGHPARDR
jgi:serine/threonine-protein kinase